MSQDDRSTSSVESGPVAVTDPGASLGGVGAEAVFGGLPADPRPVFRRCSELLGSVIREISPNELGRSTPCAEFDVRQLLGHVVAAGNRVAIIGRGEDWTPEPPGARLVVHDDGWYDAWSKAAALMEQAWSDDAALVRVIELPWIRSSGADVLAGYVNEFTVHTWDLAVATGQSPSWDDEALRMAFASIRAVLPPEGRTAQFEAVRASLPHSAQTWSAPFADAVPVAPDAPLIDRLVAFNGRHR
ncbi:MAG: TIGR03086 family metal-binding protein [Actinomycetota bacterium]|nr:TIGR03086 family metal-binding protein [Actinomycetota bacterium]